MRENSKFELFHTILKNPENTEISACWNLANMFYTFNLHNIFKNVNAAVASTIFGQLLKDKSYHRNPFSLLSLLALKLLSSHLVFFKTNVFQNSCSWEKELILKKGDIF